jgi:predicted DNA-binding transcriptional regulator YafY
MRIKGRKYNSTLRTFQIFYRLRCEAEPISLHTLAEEFGVSAKQIRRDVRNLQRAGCLVKVERSRVNLLREADLPTGDRPLPPSLLFL